MDYIHYENWDLSGKGKNISNSLMLPERAIWDTALGFQDKRNDTGHAEFVTYFALKLLEEIPAERKIVIPAAILHDTGWSQMSKTELKLFYDKNWKRYEQILRARHQEEGVSLARKLLTELKQTDNIEQVLEIISQHDTRNEFLNAEDGVVRDADKLWRFTLPHLKLYKRERKASLNEVLNQLHNWRVKPGFFCFPISNEIARAESIRIDMFTNSNFTTGDGHSDALIDHGFINDIRARFGL